MNDIKCPHCHQAFKIDESSYADIVVQIRNSEFEAEVNRRLELAEKDKKSALDLAKSEFQQQLKHNAMHWPINLTTPKPS